MLTERELTHESNKAMGWMLFFLAIAIPGAVWLGYEWHFVNAPAIWLNQDGVRRLLIMDRDMSEIRGFLIVLAIVVFSFVAAAFFMHRYFRNTDKLDDEPQPPAPPNLGPPRRDPSMMMNYQQHNTTARLENQVSDNQLLRSRFDFTPEQWGRLIDELKRYRWQWQRDKALAKSGLFESLTAPGVYRNITQDFIRLGVVKGEKRKYYVCEDGIRELHKAAGRAVVTSPYPLESL